MDPPADNWLGGERSQRIEALGFVIGGEAENFQREVRIESGGDIARIARAPAIRNSRMVVHSACAMVGWSANARK